MLRWELVTPSTFSLPAFTSGVEVSQGRFISPVDAAGGRPVCVLGDQVATNLFLREAPLGKKIKIRDQSYEVIGVLEKQGSIFGDSLDNRVIIPLKQYLGSIERDPSLNVMVKAKQLVQLDEAREELRSAMRRVRRLKATSHGMTVSRSDSRTTFPATASAIAYHRAFFMCAILIVSRNIIVNKC